MVFGIKLLQVFIRHILMDEMSTWWLDGHTDVLGRLLYKFFLGFLPIYQSCGGEWVENPFLGRSFVTTFVFTFP